MANVTASSLKPSPRRIAEVTGPGPLTTRWSADSGLCMLPSPCWWGWEEMELLSRMPGGKHDGGGEGPPSLTWERKPCLCSNNDSERCSFE